MSAPKKPSSGKPRKRIGPVATPPGPILTELELKLLSGFRGLNDNHQHTIAITLVNMAKQMPRRSAPSLQLITGGKA